jgi:acetyl-CoA C-acetyltransferase
VLAGGTDAMTHAPLMYGPVMVNWLAQWYAAKSVAQKPASRRNSASPTCPVIAILRGLTDPIVKLSMGSTARSSPSASASRAR